ncbi:hypothetical protein VIGAN_03027000 [Vigna angularis var. angularis]|uniref:Secreted protein n=1 Tax=Vigna angularis var. angularis TaxID=157739 RepID=A0A0S3RJ71_PHAAN|nr:hypothetical protein VIGAN_03027000 [Vigna angularis var. angularis]
MSRALFPALCPALCPALSAGLNPPPSTPHGSLLYIHPEPFLLFFIAYAHKKNLSFSEKLFFSAPLSSLVERNHGSSCTLERLFLAIHHHFFIALSFSNFLHQSILHLCSLLRTKIKQAQLSQQAPCSSFRE